MQDFYLQKLEQPHVKAVPRKIEYTSSELQSEIKYAYERRDRMDILLTMLEIANEPTKKTHIIYTAKINFYQVSKYLDFLLKIGMIEQVNLPFRGYRTTDKGRVFLQLFPKSVEL